jgi:hypothetical protein
MTIEQTIEIPESHRISIQVPSEVPVGRAKILIFPELAAKKPVKHRAKKSLDETLERIWSMTKDSTLTSDKFLEMKRKDLELENALDPMRRSRGK